MRFVSPVPLDTRWARRLMASVVLVVVFATACGTESAEITQTGSADTSTDASEADDGQSSDQNSDDQNSDDQGDDQGENDSANGASSGTTTVAGESKTLDEYLGTLSRAARGGGPGGGGFDESVLEEQAQVEVEVQRCMQAEGFEYVPESVGGGLGQLLAQSNQGLSAEDFAATKGFGISTRFDEIFDGDVVLEADEESENDLHIATLSEGEADAWQFALRGDPPERNAQGQLIDPETGEAIQGGRGARGPTGGCRLEANTVVRGDRTVIESLADDFDELDARIDADSRIAEIARDWTSCMRDAGFTYETLDEARGEINQDFRPLIRQAFGRGAGQGQGGPDLSDISLTPEQDAELQKLQDKEIAVATASLACEGDTRAEIAEIEARYEADFVEANRDALESISGS